MESASVVPLRGDLFRYNLKVPPGYRLDDDLLFAICQANRDAHIERSRDGVLEIMPPTGAETGRRNFDINVDFGYWVRSNGSGIGFDSSTGFLLPDGSMRSPDLAWVLRERYDSLTPKQKQKFLPLAPDFVIELVSDTDSLSELKRKMQAYIDNGTRLGWLIDPARRQVTIYRPKQEPHLLHAPPKLDGDPVLPGLKLPLDSIWDVDS